MTPTAEVSAQGVARLEASLASIDKQWEAYEAKPHGGQEVPLVRAFATENANLFKEGFEPALVALRAADPAKVQQLLVEKIRPQFLSAQQALTQLVSLHLDAAKRQIEEATARYRMIQNIATTAVVSGLLFSVCFGFALIRAIGRQLGGEPWEAAAVAQRVAAGELNTSIQLKAGDRTSLMTHLKAMQEGLTELVKRVRANSDCVATASSQIAGGDGDLSVRTEQQASALQETAASMQELTAAVTRNADSALQANQLARAASGLAGTNRWRSAPAAAVRSGPGCATGLRRDDLTISTHNSPSRHRTACIAPTSARRASRRCGRLVHPSSCAASTSHTASSRSAPASPRCPRSGAAPRAEARSSGLQTCMSHRARSHAKCPRCAF